MYTENTSGEIMARFRRHASIYAVAFILSFISFLLSFNWRPSGFWGSMIINPFGFLLFTFGFGTLSGVCWYTYKRMEAQVLEWLRQWEKETAHLSHTKQGHPLYQKIISIGKPATPVLLRELKKRECYVFSLLVEITGENPVSKEHHGNIPAMRQDWLAWGKEEGYVS